MPVRTRDGEATRLFSCRNSAGHSRGFPGRPWSGTKKKLWLCAILIMCVGCSKERFKAARDEVREQQGEKWHVVEDPSVIGFKLHAKNQIEAVHGKTAAVLVIMCTRGEGPDVWMQVPAPASADIRVAFDDAVPEKRQWGTRAGQEMLFPWKAEQPSFLAQLLKAKTLNFEYRSQGEPAQSSTFDLLNIADLVSKDQRCASPPQAPKPKK